MGKAQGWGSLTDQLGAPDGFALGPCPCIHQSNLSYGHAAAISLPATWPWWHGPSAGGAAFPKKLL